MSDPHWIDFVVAWLFAHLLHGAAWTLAVTAVLQLRPGASAAFREGLWKTALLASLLGPTLALALDAQPLTGRLILPMSAAGPVAADGSLETAAAPAQAGDHADRLAIPPADGGPTAGLEAMGALDSPVDPESSAQLRRTALACLLAGLGVLAIAGLARTGLGQRRMLRALGRRRPWNEARARARLAAMAGNEPRLRRVRLTLGSAVPVPVALGVWRPEICLPERAARQLGDEELGCVIAHELAHLRRRDPHWRLALEVLVGTLWFQPLHHLARRALRELAELRCDAWAARRTGSRTAMAGALAEVAGWVHDRPARRLAGMASMAGSPAAVGRRIRLLLDDEPCERDARRGSPLLLAGLLAAPFVLPGVRAQAPGPPAAVVAVAPSSEAAAGAPRLELAADDRDTLLGETLALLDVELAALIAESDAYSGQLLTDPNPIRLEEFADFQARLIKLLDLRHQLDAVRPTPSAGARAPASIQNRIQR